MTGPQGGPHRCVDGRGPALPRRRAGSGRPPPGSRFALQLLATVPADDPPVDDHEPPVDDHKPPVDLLDALLPPPRRARLDDGTDDGTDDDEGSANNFAVNADDCLIKIDT